MSEYVEFPNKTTTNNMNSDKNKSSSRTSSQNDDLFLISKQNDQLEISFQIKETVSDSVFDEEVNKAIEQVETCLSIKPRKLKSLDIEGVSEYMLKCKNIIFMTGAGISTSTGIPDFRSPVTGLYANLSKYNLPFPEAVFCLDYFLNNPQPFYTLSKELMPKNCKPSISHYFQKLLIDKGHVLKVYTQNIDALEMIAKIPQEKFIAAHGSFEKGRCLNCLFEYDLEWMRKQLQENEFMNCENKTCLDDELVDKSAKIVKPNITFFGEQLPDSFMRSYKQDFSNCDMLIVMGTSLKVQPFGLLTQLVDDDCPRLLINRELAGDFIYSLSYPEDNNRDVYIKGDCDIGCLDLAKSLGYLDELLKLVKRDHQRIDELNIA